MKKISDIINLLVYYKKEYGDIVVCKRGSFIGSDNIDSAFVHEDKLILFDSDKESFLLKFIGEQDDEKI